MRSSNKDFVVLFIHIFELFGEEFLLCFSFVQMIIAFIFKFYLLVAEEGDSSLNHLGYARSERLVSPNNSPVSIVLANWR